MFLFSYSDPVTLMLMLGMRLLIVFTVLPIHEFAHGYAAKKLGDNTALISGRLTINPLAHIDPVGAVFLILFGFGWARPVPVNPRNFKKYKRDVALTAAAGPLSNLLCATLGVFVMRIFENIRYTSESGLMNATYIYSALNFFVLINLSLAVFNLIPVSPLDGSKILSFFLPAKANAFIYKNQQYFYIALMILIATRILQVPLSLLTGLLYSGLNWLFSWIDLLFNLIYH